MRTLKTFKLYSILCLGALAILVLAESGFGLPKEIIPASVASQLALLNEQFETNLYQECRKGNCFNKGCHYLEHKVVSKRGDVALPGIYGGRTPLKGPEPQAYLTRARCSYSFEQALKKQMIGDLDQRLRQKLSSGFLQVSVSSASLAPMHRELVTLEHKEGGESFSGVERWTQKAIESTLPVIPWLVGFAAATFCFMIGIWGFRRLGLPSMEDRLLYQQLQVKADAEAEAFKRQAIEEEELAKKRVATENKLEAYLEEGDLLQKISEYWLKKRDFEALSIGVDFFGSRGFSMFQMNQDMFGLRQEFNDYYEARDHQALADDRFLEKLERAAAAIRGLGDHPYEVFYRFSECYNAAQIAEIFEMMPVPAAAVSLTFLSPSKVSDVVGKLSPEMNIEIARRLLKDDRMSRSLYVVTKEWLLATMEERTPNADVGLIEQTKGGVRLEVAVGLSHLFMNLNKATRAELIKEAQRAHRGQIPSCAEELFYPSMLSALTREQTNDLLLEQDLDQLSIWFERLSDQQIKRKILNEAPNMVRERLKNPARVDDLRAEQYYGDAIKGLAHSVKHRLHNQELRLEHLL